MKGFCEANPKTSSPSPPERSRICIKSKSHRDLHYFMCSRPSPLHRSDHAFVSKANRTETSVTPCAVGLPLSTGAILRLYRKQIGQRPPLLHVQSAIPSPPEQSYVCIESKSDRDLRYSMCSRPSPLHRSNLTFVSKVNRTGTSITPCAGGLPPLHLSDHAFVSKANRTGTCITPCAVGLPPLHRRGG
jgi:hypothetical protein